MRLFRRTFPAAPPKGGTEDLLANVSDLTPDMFLVAYDLGNLIIPIAGQSEAYTVFEAVKRNLGDFTKMKREKVSEYYVILTSFYQILVKFLTPRLARIFL